MTTVTRASHILILSLLVNATLVILAPPASAEISFLTETVAPGEARSLAAGPDGRLHLAYSDAYRVWYAVNAGSGWVAEMVDSAASVVLDVSLALDPAGEPRIASTRNAPFQQFKKMRYMERAVGGWQGQDVDSTTSVLRGPSLAIDASGIPHLAYQK